MTKPTMWLCAHRRLRSDWASASLIRVFVFRMKKAFDAQADLSLRWAHTHFVGFVMMRLKCFK